jgi:ABC-type branched-subunit amino acid transport system substrate-binding protein
VAVVAALVFIAGCAVTVPRNGWNSGTRPTGTSGVANALPGSQGPAGETEGGADAAISGAGATGTVGGGLSAATAGSGTGGSANPASAATVTGQGQSPASGSGGAGLPVKTVGVTASTITISAVAGFSGAEGTLTQQVYQGMLTWQADVNAHGGIYGRKVVLKQVDTAFTADGGVAACKAVLSNGSFSAILFSGGDDVIAASDCLDKAHFVNLYIYAAQPIYSKWHYSFSMATHYDDSGTSAASYANHRLHDGAKKLGLVCLNTVDTQYSCGAFKNEARAEHLNVVDVESLEQNQSSCTSEDLHLQGAGVQQVTVFATLESVCLIRDAKAIGYNPQWTLGDFALDFLTQAARNLFTGVTGLRDGATTDTPGYAAYSAKASQYGHGNALEQDSFIVYGESLVLGKALAVAGSNPTEASLLAGLEGLTSYANAITPPLSYSAADHAGSHDSFPAVCCTPNWTWKGDGAPALRF